MSQSQELFEVDSPEIVSVNSPKNEAGLGDGDAQRCKEEAGIVQSVETVMVYDDAVTAATIVEGVEDLYKTRSSGQSLQAGTSRSKSTKSKTGERKVRKVYIPRGKLPRASKNKAKMLIKKITEGYTFVPRAYNTTSKPLALTGRGIRKTRNS